MLPKTKVSTPLSIGKNVRASAALAFLKLYQKGKWEGGFSPNPPKAMRSQGDRAMYAGLLRGVVRHARFLLHEVARLNQSRPPTEKVLALALVGLFQLRFLNIPAHAAVNETVAAASLLRVPAARAWLNGILRTAVREGLRETHTTQTLPMAVATSYPDWMVERWETQYGTEITQKICLLGLQFQGTCVRVETRRIQAKALQLAFANEGIQAKLHPILPHALWLERLAPLWHSKAFGQGLCYVQDTSSLLCLEWLLPAVMGDVLDVCAAPGGKWSFLLSALKQQQARQHPPAKIRWVLGCDHQAQRLDLMRENLKRLRLGNAPLLCANGTRLPFGSGHQSVGFDTVLLDAPCSATGVLRTHPEIKWQRRPTDLEQWSNTQATLLQEAARVCKAGGKVIYITCSLEKEENQHQVERFLAQQPTWKRISFRQYAQPIPSKALPQPTLSAQGDFQLLPGPYWNGLYAAILQKPGKIPPCMPHP